MRIVNRGIKYCISCHSLYTDKRKRDYIDFESFYDGPVIQHPDIPSEKYEVSDVIICDECLKKAAKLLGLVEDEKLKQENEELGELLDKKEEEALELHSIITDLEHTVSTFTKEKIKKPSRRPKIVTKEKVEV